jgi:hypothetical protein
MDHYQALALTWRDNFPLHRITPRERLDSQRRFQLDTELAATALINGGLYKAPESSELDSLLTKEIRKVCLL